MSDRPLNPFARIAEEQGAVVLDGGLATTLEARGWDLNDELWSAKLLLEAPSEVRAVHTAFLEAGADCIVSATYQATLEGFRRKGIEGGQGVALLRQAVELALEARDAFWALPENRPGRVRPLVAAGVGPYGAFLADGSEYTGKYDIDEEALYHFHKERWDIFCDTPADLLACETIPSMPEVRALLRLLNATPSHQAWLSFSCRDEEHLADGTPLARVARACDEVANVVAVGVNCIKPELVTPLLQTLGRETEKPLLAYPNSGELYDIGSRSWQSEASPLDWEEAAASWVGMGACGVGGCCRVGPGGIMALRNRLVR